MVEFSLFLYYKPCPDMGIEGEQDFNPAALREQAEFLAESLAQTADWLDVLKKNGWSYCGGLYDIHCYKDISKQQAIKELKKLKVSIDSENLIEFEDEEDYEEENVYLPPAN